MNKKLAVLAVVGLMAAAIAAPASPAQANPFAGVAVCDVHLDPFPGTGSTTCNGTATGVDVAGTVCLPSCTFTATADYTEPCVVAAGFPLVGTANGTISIDGNAIGTYTWIRVGLTAVLVPVGGTTAGVATFVPHAGVGSPLPACGAPGQLDATVVGLAAII